MISNGLAAERAPSDTPALTATTPATGATQIMDLGRIFA
jgi:hypothetical protein